MSKSHSSTEPGQLQHDYIGSDGSTPSNYGNGWTNTFDAHISFDATDNVMVVSDIDGARYFYSYVDGCTWAPPPGEHATLTCDGEAGYFWVKKTGTSYYFYSPKPGLWPGGYAGRLYQIRARNANNTITFGYSWLNGDASSADNLATIVAQHSDGQALTLSFASFSGRQLLASVTRPDGQAVTFQYDANGNLTDVYDIGNDAATNATPLHHQYGWNANHQMAWANSANWTMSGGVSGAYVAFGYDGSNRTTTVQYNGVVNFTPSDGTGTQLQPGATGAQLYRSEAYDYGTPGQTTLTDTEGHATIYTYDGLDRVTQTQDWTGTQYLVNNATWDANNNLTAVVDPRSNETDYAYDANGNTIEVALPQVATSAGTIRPTSVYSYDQYSNITAYCDPVFANVHGLNWTAPPAQSDTLCPNEAGAQRLTYDYSDSSEPFGRLASSESPCYGDSCTDSLGKHETYTYSPSGQGGDFGLPTTVTQDCYTQYDQTQVCPQQTFAYDADGNLTSYNNGNGTTTLTYDANNRMVFRTDPDGIPSRTCYEDDGSVAATQTAAQGATSGGSCTGTLPHYYTYDDDGNKITDVRDGATTTNWYDGDDRLVEVGLPRDPSDYWSFAWLTRNIYDLSQNQTVSIATASGLYAHGNLYKTQEWGGTGWDDLKGDAYDAMDRQVAHYQWAPNVVALPPPATSLYDQSTATLGLLSQKTDAIGENTLYTYDADAKVVETSYSGDGGVTPSETVTNDPDGRAVSVVSSTMGTQTSTYDADGNVTTEGEATGGGVTSPATYTYAYYPTGQRESLSVASSALTQSKMLQYAYRADGQRTGLAFADGAATATISWVRDASGRVTTINDSSGYPGRVLSYDPDGRVDQDQMASGTTTGIAYDSEDQLGGFTTPLSPSNTADLHYTVRGEFQAETYSAYASPNCGPPLDPTYNPIQLHGANGYMVADQQSGGPPCGTWIPGDAFWDARTGVGYGSDSPDGKNQTIYSYDNAGRQVSAWQTWYWTSQCGDTPCDHGGSGTQTRSYDAENHLLGESVAWWDIGGGSLSGCLAFQPESNDPVFANGTFSYAWGPNGHPVLFSQTNVPTYSVHWDGSTPLFVTSSTSTVAEIKVEGLGYYVPGSTFKFVDRNQSGFAVAAHWSGGDAPWTPADAQHQTCSGIDYSGAVLFEPGPDGISDGTNIIQGVRNYDPSLGSWTTPDAYAGDPSDPMSRKSYMWNGNNSMIYSDPSGYCQGQTATSLGTQQVTIAKTDSQGRTIEDSNGNVETETVTEGTVLVDYGGCKLAHFWEDNAAQADFVNGGLIFFVPGGEEIGATDLAAEGAIMLGNKGYLEAAKVMGARALNVSPKVWAKMSDAGRWALNKKFIDDALERGDAILFSTLPEDAAKGSFFEREVMYLRSLGYNI